MSAQLAVGLISGTSMDGVDAALVRRDGDACELVAFRSYPYDEGLRVLLRRCQREGRLEALARLDIVLGEVFAEAAGALLADAGIRAAAVDCIGSHGQTLLHLPEPSHEYGRPVRATLQIADSAVIAARTGIVTVADFRAADMALGGQGAPLVPWLDWHLFRDATRDRILLNLGGVANVTWLPAGGGLQDVVAFDTGPANILIDALARRHDLPGGIDAEGALAARGQVDPVWLEALLADPYYDMPPPKSADAAQFEALLPAAGSSPASAEDLVATVTELSARTVADAIQRWLPPAPGAQLVAAGGGVHNATLMARIAALADGLELVPLMSIGDVQADAKEAMAFALLALETLARRPGNVPSATGASAPAILGKIALPPP